MPGTTQDDSEMAICAMTVPSPESPEPPLHDNPSPVDWPYDISSFGHLIIPHSPARSRRYTGEHFSWSSGSQTSLHEEPSPIDHGPPRPRLHSILPPTTSTSSIHAEDGIHRQSPEIPGDVLLNANVGFLAIQSVDDGGGTTLRQLASYMSLVASLASIVLGLVFVGHNRTDTRNTAFQAAKFLDRLQHKRHGLETLAIIYSLPYAFLMWAMVLFFAAFVSEWCGGSRDTKSLTSVGAFMFLVASLVAWCIWTSREQTEYWWFEADPEQVELCDHEETDGVSWTQKLFGLLLQSIPSSWTKHRTSSLDSRSESLAMQEIPRPQDAPEVPDDSRSKTVQTLALKLRDLRTFPKYLMTLRSKTVQTLVLKFRDLRTFPKHLRTLWSKTVQTLALWASLSVKRR
ncbi:hypothetical protein BU15DRAFT_65866 [Melanogaster broomeanus]|nr:hypothetical protein BU15DRAFT_65866 [Melanogaster broomeanus]